MSTATIADAAELLIHLRKNDSPTGISQATMQQLEHLTGLSAEEVIHLALRNFANQYLPAYEPDDGPLTPEQIRAIRAASAATDTPDEKFTDRLF